jgi:hypothetical protein
MQTEKGQEMLNTVQTKADAWIKENLVDEQNFKDVMDIFRGGAGTTSGDLLATGGNLASSLAEN